MSKFLKSKTTWVALAAIATSVGMYFNGDVSLGQAIQLVFTSLFGVTLRDAIVSSRQP